MPPKAIKNKPRPTGNGWRFLKVGEVIRAGDEFADIDGTWNPTWFPGCLVQISESYRRKETQKCSKPVSMCSRQLASSQLAAPVCSSPARCSCQAGKAVAKKKCRAIGVPAKTKTTKFRALKVGEMVIVGDEATSAVNHAGVGYLPVSAGHGVIGTRVGARDTLRFRRPLKGGRA
jgi:hypothetical protein